MRSIFTRGVGLLVIAGAVIVGSVGSPCDGSFYRRVVRLRATGVPFESGWVRLDSFLHTLDPVNRDPAPGVVARGVRVP